MRSSCDPLLASKEAAVVLELSRRAVTRRSLLGQAATLVPRAMPRATRTPAARRRRNAKDLRDRAR